MLTISPDGTARCLYTESLPLESLGACEIHRASNVEPDGIGLWYANIIDGPHLGPFPTRSAALAAEVEYLESNTL